FHKLIQMHPFRPFQIRLNNGAAYQFVKPEQFGAPGNPSAIFHFGPDDDWTIIDINRVSEIKTIQRDSPLSPSLAAIMKSSTPRMDTNKHESRWCKRDLSPLTSHL